MSVRLTQEQVNELCDYIVGTTKFTNDGLAAMELDITEDDLDAETLGMIDEKVFLCAACGWTCDIDEMSSNEEEQTCSDCEEDDDA